MRLKSAEGKMRIKFFQVTNFVSACVTVSGFQHPRVLFKQVRIAEDL